MQDHVITDIVTSILKRNHKFLYCGRDLSRARYSNIVRWNAQLFVAERRDGAAIYYIYLTTDKVEIDMVEKNSQTLSRLYRNIIWKFPISIMAADPNLTNILEDPFRYFK